MWIYPARLCCSSDRSVSSSFPSIVCCSAQLNVFVENGRMHFTTWILLLLHLLIQILLRIGPDLIYPSGLKVLVLRLWWLWSYGITILWKSLLRWLM